MDRGTSETAIQRKGKKYEIATIVPLKQTYNFVFLRIKLNNELLSFNQYAAGQGSFKAGKQMDRGTSETAIQRKGKKRDEIATVPLG